MTALASPHARRERHPRSHATISWTDPARARFSFRDLNGYEQLRAIATRRGGTAARRRAARHAARQRRARTHRVQHGGRRDAREPDGHDARRDRRDPRRHRDGLRASSRCFRADADVHDAGAQDELRAPDHAGDRRRVRRGSVVHSGGRVATDGSDESRRTRHAVRARDVDLPDRSGRPGRYRRHEPDS